MPKRVHSATERDDNTESKRTRKANQLVRPRASAFFCFLSLRTI